MLYSIGDSHCDFTFRDISQVSINRVGPVTLKRAGYAEDSLLPEFIEKFKLSVEDYLLFSFGEIDVRCFVKPNLERLKVSIEHLLQNWVLRYLNRISLLNTNGSKIIVMSVVPPATASQIYSNENFPVCGTDEERSLYTKEINQLLSDGCRFFNFIYLDIYSKYKDERGMLIKELSDGGVHILNNDFVKEILIKMELIK